jgi:site-specific DNA-methyltransferase (adenine-specific)
MVTKALKRKEVELGFIQIPAKSRVELIGQNIPPFSTKVNGMPAKVDKYGRLWSDFLRRKYVVGTEIVIHRNNGCFEIDPVEFPIENPEVTPIKTDKNISSNIEVKPDELEMKPSNIQQSETKIEPMKPYFQANDAWIFNDNVIQTKAIENDSVDLIITSPPYNVDIKYNSHDDKISYDEYLEFSRKWMTRCYDWLKKDGRFCLNIPLDKNKNGQQSVGADLTTIAKKIGFKYHSTIVWNEGNISRRTAWGSWMRASAPFVIAPVELIVVLYKESWKKTSGSKVSDISRDDFMNWTNGLWTFQGESKKRAGHPAPFPIELPHRCIKLFSYVGDVVLDPFLGSGTTLVAAISDKRKGIGIDVDLEYCKLSKKRLIAETHILNTTLSQHSGNVESS